MSSKATISQLRKSTRTASDLRFFEGPERAWDPLSGATEGSLSPAKGKPSGTAYPIAAGYD